MNVTYIVWVGLAGSLGAAARFMTDGFIRARLSSRIPIGTISINLSGSLLLGVLTGLVVFHHVTSTLTLVVGSGFCGGFTTFSTKLRDSAIGATGRAASRRPERRGHRRRHPGRRCRGDGSNLLMTGDREASRG